MTKKKAPSKTIIRLLHDMVSSGSTITYARYGATPFIHLATEKVNFRTFHKACKDGYLVETGKPTWRTTEYALTEAGRKVVEENPTIDDEVEPRLAITRGTRNAPAGILVEIHRETEKRHYVRVVATRLGDSFSRWEVVHGRSPNEYVDVGDILYDNATKEQYERLVELHGEHRQWKKALDAQLEEELRPIKDRYDDRRHQKAQEIDMMAKEIFEAPPVAKRVKNG